MKKIIPFEKEIIFKTNISEITSISLERQLFIKDSVVNGELIISGEYKISDTSTTVEAFNFNLPLEINIDSKYDTSLSEVDIDDFYYEVINNSVLKVCIDIKLDKLEEKKEIMEEKISDNKESDRICESEKTDAETDTIKIEELTQNINTTNLEEIEDDLKIKKGDGSVEPFQETTSEVSAKKEEVDNVKEKMNSLFSNMNNGDNYVSYNIYIIREGDTIETILEKYDTTDEDLRKYNDLSDLQIGDKIVIPNNQ